MLVVGLVAGPTVTLVGSFLGWARTGEATRSSYRLLRSARTLGVLPDPFDRLAALWYLLPVAVGVLWLAAATGRVRLAGALALVVGLGAGAAVVAVVRSPLLTAAGLAVAGAGAVLSLVGGLAALLAGSPAGRGHP